MKLGFGEEVIKNLFDQIEQKEQSFYTKRSSSGCMDPMPKSFATQLTDDDMDPRLKAWKNMLKQRKKLQIRIQDQTGKRAEDVLFNQHVTINDQTKKTILRLLDTSERIDGPRPDYVRPVLKTRVDPVTCCEIRELPITEPQLQVFEFVGLPEVSRIELADTLHPDESPWMRSTALSDRLDRDEERIVRSMTYCPRLDNLQIAPTFEPVIVPVQDTKLLYEDELLKVSSTTSRTQISDETLEYPDDDIVIEVTDSSDNGQVRNLLRVNGVMYGFGDMATEMSRTETLYFQCDPFQRVRKTIVHLENVGNKFIMVKWQNNSLYNKALNQQIIYSNTEFVFDSQPFVLEPKEMRTIDVMYQPSAVGIKKQSWTLIMHRSPFCGTCRLEVKFHGLCTIPIWYRRRLEMEQQLVVDKRILQVTNRLAKMHAELVPIIEPQHMLCPYDRPLDDRERFAALNPGFKCERYADLEALRELYTLVKKPRQPPWDLAIDTLRLGIYRHSPAEREVLQKVLLNLIEPMRCNISDGFEKCRTNEERKRSCFLYVRGIISSAIEEWELLSEGLQQQYFKSELQRFYLALEDLEEDLAGGEEKEEEKEEEMNEKKLEKMIELPTDEEDIDAFVLKKVRTNKYFKDTLYIQTYTLLCDTAENIVSAIESTCNL